MILDKIVKQKREEVAESVRRRPLAELRRQVTDAPPPRDLFGALAARRDVALIAELKRKSPSAGLIRADFDPAAIAQGYYAAGAAALSVLTDARFFGGELAFIGLARAAAPLPVLCKDFVIDEYQLYEARAAGADAVLLIVRILSDGELRAHLALARGLGMAALLEAHDPEELKRAVATGAGIVGINNRDLDTLGIDLATTEVLARRVPPGRVIVSESGIGSRRDVERLAACGISAVLVGETLMRSGDVREAAAELVGVPRIVAG